jgi:hypothetical protein
MKTVYQIKKKNQEVMKEYSWIWRAETKNLIKRMATLSAAIRLNFFIDKIFNIITMKNKTFIKNFYII